MSHVSRDPKDTVRLASGDEVPRTITMAGGQAFIRDQRDGVSYAEVDASVAFRDDGSTDSITVTLRAPSNEPGLTDDEIGRVNLAVLRHSLIFRTVFLHRLPVTTSDMAAYVLTEQMGEAQRAAGRATGWRHPRAVPDERLAEILEAFEAGGINAVMKMGYSRSQAYKLAKRAKGIAR
jgi:hypothetical protein